MHPIIEENRKDDLEPVRIAILDTGVDATHPDLRDAIDTGKIETAQAFPASLDPLADRNGHGTHGASVIMATAPNAVVLVGRIADDNGQLDPTNDYEAVAQVAPRCAIY